MKSLTPVRMREVRKSQKKTYADLARATGMQAGVISWIETGRFIPYESQLEKIAAVLGVNDPESLLEPLEVIS